MGNVCAASVLIQMDKGKLLILEMLEAGPTEIGIQSATRAVVWAKTNTD